MSQTVDQGGGNRQAGILATVLVSTILATFTVALRMVTRIRLVRIVGWDDYTIVCATRA